ncbi:SGNH/GDSL hydrolase family protein [Adhaeribacter pallidiroseus]|uniref:SGNH hydrolase-type esterase domain-containing protein n=1 Tax=Adhaeribacter pallidiroseus TaxID=2072847 RepID=A0A369QGV4_9BACT|nr:SGNH/GDSL hydrolase family protein [Adhaeribacter pallidiroseus]RDC62785.1 hypothetical protein AHMF7616_01379 [Adhaeribacter pallidiroseus]
MNRSLRFTLILSFLLIPVFSVSAQPMAPNVQRVVFLGNSITYAGNYVNNVAAYVMAQNPARNLEFINVGLPSETVSGLSEEGHAGGSFPRPDLHERLSRVLEKIKPDQVFACYGMNDGIYLPFDEARFAKFKEGITWLHEQVVKSGARIIHVTPPDYDEYKGKQTGYAAVLDKYADWLMSQRKSGKWEVVDIHYPMQKYLRAHRLVDAQFKIDGFALAPDGVHPGETGHWIMSREVLKYIGFKEAATAPSIAESLKQIPEATQYLKLVTERQNLLRDAWLSDTQHQRPGLPAGLPLSEAQTKAAELKKQLQTLLASKK